MSKVLGIKKDRTKIQILIDLVAEIAHVPTPLYLILPRNASHSVLYYHI